SAADAAAGLRLSDDAQRAPRSAVVEHHESGARRAAGGDPGDHADAEGPEGTIEGLAEDLGAIDSKNLRPMLSPSSVRPVFDHCGSA
ncbi:MAG: hypothetical protein M3065_09245, partial [Actinomycetota bacterium]|nr:hypothetical protein [Actinomycetota bacterium]